MNPPASTNALRKELRLPDLVWMQLLLVVGIPWTGIAARQGGTHVVFWLAGTVFFFLPTAAVVSFCVRQWPEEGGVYQWIKHTMGPFPAFLAAWNLYAWTILTVSNLGLVTASSLAYALGPQAAWMANSKAFIACTQVALFAIIFGANLFGMRWNKWLIRFSTSITIAVAALLTALLIWHPHSGTQAVPSSPQPPFVFAMPILTLMSLTLFAKMSFHSLGGVEQVAVFAEETVGPAQAVMRSAWIAAPACAAIYILLTGSLLTYIPASQIDLIAPVSQVLSTAFGGSYTHTGFITGQTLGRAAILLLAAALVGQYALLVAQASRLSLVAGWDGRMPRWFTSLHPRWKTPVWSIAVVVLLAIGVGLFALQGVGAQEAYQLLVEGSSLCFAIYYLLMLLIPLMARRLFTDPPGWPLRGAALTALAVTLTAAICTMIPIVKVANPWIFAAKIAGVTGLLNGIGAAIYRLEASRKADSPLYPN